MSWPEVLDARARIAELPATYILTLSQSFGRLRGESDVLYIGRTGKLGGTSDRCRLRIYRYPNGHHARELNRRTRQLIDAGLSVQFHWAFHESEDEARTAERTLLAQYAEAHLELPPFNGRPENEL